MHIIATVIVWGIVILWIGSLLLRVMVPNDPDQSNRPRRTDNNWIVRGIVDRSRRRIERGTKTVRH